MIPGVAGWKKNTISLKVKIEWIVFDSDAAAASTIGKEKVETVWKAVGEELGVANRDLPEFIDKFWQGDVLDQKLLDFLTSLRPDYITGILSNAWEGVTRRFCHPPRHH